ncbi:MAG: hypothetical protein DRO98_05730 [Archaeoglobales archaeon]|nr:MAG: hypothetical protein DRO98_05730 [Archaeoglobales archaeon]
MKFSLLTLSVIVLLLVPAEAANLHGVIYNWENLEPLPKAVIIINTTPEQRFVTEDGTYSFNLSPGSYTIKAFYYREGKLELYAEENITITSNGDYVHDIILFPPLEFGVEEPNVEFPSVEGENGFPTALAVGFIAAFSIIALVIIKIRSKRAATAGREEIEEMQTGESVKIVEKELPEDLREVVEILKKEGGRMTQKELRKRLGYSEAKVSLLIADLERRGIIEKVKKGRGNIIFLKEF